MFLPLSFQEKKLICLLRKKVLSSSQRLGLFLFGSRFQTHGLADRFSDLDIGIINNDNVYLSLPERDLIVHSVIHSPFHTKHEIILKDGSICQIINLSQSQFAELCHDDKLYNGIFVRGFLPLVDKEGLLAALRPKELCFFADMEPLDDIILESQARDCVYHFLTMDKLLQRGEILTANEEIQVIIRQILLPLSRNYIFCTAPHTDTYHDARHFERWAPQTARRICSKLLSLCTRKYVKTENLKILRLLQNFFEETAQSCGFNFNSAVFIKAAQCFNLQG